MTFFKISKAFIFLAALQILNMSIDAPAAQMPGSFGEDDFNYIDTFTEYVIEDVFDFNNVIPESRDRQQKDSDQHKFEIVLEKMIPIYHFQHFNHIKIKHSAYRDQYALQFIKEVIPEPPKI